MLAFIMTPLAVGLGTLAPTLTKLFLNRRWAEVGPMLMWLSVIRSRGRVRRGPGRRQGRRSSGAGRSW